MDTTTQPKTKKIYRIDASSLVQSNCELRWKRIVVDGYREKEIWNDTKYGNAYHHFMAQMALTDGDAGSSLLSAEQVLNKHNAIRFGKKHLDKNHLFATCADSIEFLKNSDIDILKFGDKPCVELDFSIPYFNAPEFEIHLSGTMDFLGKIKNGCYVIGDYKTHSLWSVSKNGSPDAEINKFFERFRTSTQLRFYYFCFKLMATLNPSSQIAEICKTKVGTTVIGVFLSKSTKTLFRRSEVFFYSDDEWLEFQTLLDKKVETLIHLINHPDYSIRNGFISGTCMEQAYPCPFIPVCGANKPVQQLILARDFNQQEYNPLEFSK